MALSGLRRHFLTEDQVGERKLVRKIDFFILTFCCLSYFLNYVSDAPPPSQGSVRPSVAA